MDSTICYGSAIVEADCADDAVKKFYELYPPIDYHSEEISDVTAESIDEGANINNEKY